MDDELLDQIAKLYEKAQIEKTGTEVIALFQVPVEMANRISQCLNKNVLGYAVLVSFDTLRHIYQMHGKSFDKFNNQRPVETNDIYQIPSILLEFDDIEFQEKDLSRKKFHDSFLFIKQISTEHRLACEIRAGKQQLVLKTFYIKKNR